MIHKPVVLLSICCVALRSSFGNTIKQCQNLLKVVFPLIIIIAFSSCGSNKTEPEEEILPSNSSSVFYPIHEYFITQIIKADSSHLINYTYKDSDNKSDSAVIDSIKFNQLAQPFLNDNINDSAIKKYYRESIFNDATTASNTFTYTSVNPELRLQTLDILLDTITDNVKHVFITKNFKSGDSTVTEKLTWKTNQNFSIHRIIQIVGNKETTQQINVLWNSNH